MTYTAPTTRRDRAMLCQAIGIHDGQPGGYCRDCGVLLDATALTCADRPTGPVIR